MPSVVSISSYAFSGCFWLTSVFMPSVSSVASGAFNSYDYAKFTMPFDFDIPEESMIPPANVVRTIRPGMTYNEIVQAECRVRNRVVSGEADISVEEYKDECLMYGVTPMPDPAPLPDDAIVIGRSAIEAAKADVVEVSGGVARIGVSVSVCDDITADKREWQKVKFTPGTTITVSEDGMHFVLPVSIKEQQGFMILLSKAE